MRCPLSVTLTLGLLIAAVGLPGPAMAKEQYNGSPCAAAGVAFWKTGDRLLEHYADQHGHDVEVWCTSGVFIAHYDLRVGWDQPANPHSSAGGRVPATVHRSAVIGACVFNYGKNTGPDIYRTPTGAYSRVEWTTRNVASRQDYHFSYDFHTGLVTVTATAPCSAPVSKVIAPQPSYHDLAALLPDPPEAACPLTSVPAGTGSR